jgi:hypothetical protein
MNVRSENGSALVLTLLFIMLLTTMSTAMYLYATKQSIFADAQYTTVASSYVADAGVEHGKALLATRDILLNTYGQNPSDNKVDRDDFPVILPMSPPFGQFSMEADGERITDGKQGVGTYSIRIDGAFSEIVDFDVELQRDAGFQATALKYGDPSRCNRLLPGKTLQVQVRQGIEVVNAYKYHYLDDNIILGQDPGTLRYNPMLANIINPFIGDDVTFEINRTNIKAEEYKDTPRETRDAWGNSLLLFPNDLAASDKRNEERLIDLPKTGTDALFFTPEPFKAYATYIVHVRNLNPASQGDVQVELFYQDSVTGMNSSIVIASPSDWSGGMESTYTLLDFSNDGGWSRDWILNTDHPINGSGAGTTGNSIVMDVTGTLIHGGIQVTVSRGIPGEIDVGLRMRTEGMASYCWFPDYPNCPGMGAYYPLMTMEPSVDNKTINLTTDLMSLGHKNRIRVNELYTISSTGNVETSVETRAVMATPISFLDYARFSQYRILIPQGTMYGGKVYCQERIELRGPVKSYFYDDVLTSSDVHSPEYGEFPLGGQFYENVPLIEFPPLEDVHAFFAANSSNAWIIGSPYSTQHYDLFLGNYGHVQTQVSNTFWGFDFTGTSPVYHQPDPSIMNSDCYSYRDGWSPGGLEPSTTTLPEDFNGLIIVNGNVHVWGKLHGRSLTIVARGDIFIEREILMGTDILDPDSPGNAMSSNMGMPVNLALIALHDDGFGEFDGDIYLSENTPRIMKIESALMAFAGHIMTEDNDHGPGDPGDAYLIDTDHSHKFAIPQWSNMYNCYIWNYQENLPADGISYDLNDDGRLTDGRDYNFDELPRIELGEWNEKSIVQSDYIWYLMLVGSFIDRDGAAFGNYAARGGTTAVAGYRNGITRNFRYDPSMRINMPPLIPMPQNTLKILERDHAYYY